MKKIGSIKPDKEPVTYEQLRRRQRLEGRQRDGEVTRVIAPRSGRPGSEQRQPAAISRSGDRPVTDDVETQPCNSHPPPRAGLAQRLRRARALGDRRALRPARPSWCRSRRRWCGSGSSIARGEFLAQFLDSPQLFLTGFVLALIVGAPLGLLLARVRVLRIGVEPYIMIALCHADGGADPLHPVADGLRLRAQGAGGVPVRGVSRCSTTRSKAPAASSRS